MHLIRKIEVEGFWDTYRVVTPINDDVTFFIGENGTGKTTLINLIASALTGDFVGLEKMPFKKISIHLSKDESGKQPTITVSKGQRKERPVQLIEYKIREDEGAADTKYSLDETQERMWLRRGERYLQEYYRHYATGLVPALRDLVQVHWLSVHRTPSAERLREERTYESTVDRRLEAISNELVRFFSSLSKRKDEEVRKFQEFIFISLLEQPSDNELFRVQRSQKLDEDKDAIKTIFQELSVSNPNAPRLIESFYSRAEELYVRMRADFREFKASDLSVLSSSRRIDAVVDKWRSHKAEIDRIFSQRDKFIAIINSLLRRKQMEVSDSNELVFVTRTDKRLTPQMLSSGEKQLLILLSEALIQRQVPSIFIADEPELSLHVRWQEKLVPSLREINNKAQIIAATHSPDIVGPLADRTVDMETLIP